MNQQIKNYAYVTLLSTDHYYEGVIVLFESLKRTQPKYQNFIVVINEKISDSVKYKLIKKGYQLIEKESIDASNYVKNNNFQYWINTFDKLNVFELVEFEKIIYLDSDLYINKNIDELFELPNMSAVISGKGYVKEWEEMNSGVIVIEPKHGLTEKMIQILKNEKFDKNIGDQDIINRYFDWKNKNLAISEIYNMYYNFVDYYVKYLNYNLEDFKIIHFIGQQKPWMMSEDEIQSYRVSTMRDEKNSELYYFNKYIDILNEIRDK